MKLLLSLCLLVLYVSNCLAGNGFGYAIWNFNSTCSAVGVVDLPVSTATPKFFLPNSQHLYPGNQFSTFNRQTKTISYLVNSTVDNQIYLHTLSVDTWESGPSVVFPHPFALLSLESAQSTNVNTDLLIVMTETGSYSNFIVGTMDPTTAKYTTFDTIQGYTFASASFDQQNNVFVVMMTDSTGAYIVNFYSMNGSKISSNQYKVSNFAPGYSSVGAPSNLVYLSKFASFYFNLNIVGGGSSISKPQLFKLYAPSQSFSLLPIVSNQCNTVSNGIVQGYDSGGSVIALQFFQCGRTVQQMYDLTNIDNVIVYQTPVSIINAWNLNF